MGLARVRPYWLRIASFATLVRANAGPTRSLNEELVTEFGLTVEEYEVVLRIARAPGMRMRELDLAAQPLLTAAKVTRVLDRLERRGLVDRGYEVDDRNVLYVTLTDAGRAKTRDATANHAAQVEKLFGALFDDESLQALLARLAIEPG
jgi:DNA-binding MarR family transcriptional regulator